MKTFAATLALLIVLCTDVPVVADTIILGNYRFNSDQFGDSATGTAIPAWLNVINANPGNATARVTGANFNTGAVDDGLSLSFLIHYATPIVNRPGDDLGIVWTPTNPNGRYTLTAYSGQQAYPALSCAYPDPQHGCKPASTDNPSGSRAYFSASGATSPNEARDYTLYVIPVDLSDYGVPEGASIDQVLWNNAFFVDLIRVAGFEAEPVPAPSTFLLLGSGLLLIGLLYRRRHAAGRRN